MGLCKRSEIGALLDDISQGNLFQCYLFIGERYLCRESADLIQAALLKNQQGTVHPIDGDQEDHSRTLGQLLSFSLLPGRQIYRITDSRLFLSKSVASNFWSKAEQALESGKKRSAVRQLHNLLDSAGIQLEKSENLSDIPSDQWQKLFGFQKPSGDLLWADQLLQETGGPPNRRKSENGSDAFLQAIEKGLPQQNIVLLTVETLDKRQKLFNQIKKHGQVVDCSVETGASSRAQ